MEEVAIPVAAIVMGGLLLTAAVWKVLDLAMHAMSLERAGAPDAPTDGAREHRRMPR